MAVRGTPRGGSLSARKTRSSPIEPAVPDDQVAHTLRQDLPWELRPFICQPPYESPHTLDHMPVLHLHQPGGSRPLGGSQDDYHAAQVGGERGERRRFPWQPGILVQRLPRSHPNARGYLSSRSNIIHLFDAHQTSLFIYKHRLPACGGVRRIDVAVEPDHGQAGELSGWANGNLSNIRHSSSSITSRE